MAWILAPSSAAGAVVMDVNVSIGFTATETGELARARAILDHYLGLGYTFIAPGILIAKTLDILCQKMQPGNLSKAHRPQASEGNVLLLAHRLPKTSLHYSLDEGRTWRGPVLVDDMMGAYPSRVNLRDESILCIYHEERALPAIHAAVLRVEPLRIKACRKSAPR